MNHFQKTSFLVSLIAVSLTPACHWSKGNNKVAMSTEANKAEDLLTKIDEFVYEGPLFLKNKSLSEVRSLGKLKNERVTFEDNPHVDNAKIEFRTFEFDGLEVSGIVDKDSFSAISATVTSPQWPILHGLSVGSSAPRVPAALGQPPRKMNGPVEEFSGETETVKFTVSQGKITKIEFLYYFD